MADSDTDPSYVVPPGVAPGVRVRVDDDPSTVWTVDSITPDGGITLRNDAGLMNILADQRRIHPLGSTQTPKTQQTPRPSSFSTPLPSLSPFPSLKPVAPKFPGNKPSVLPSFLKTIPPASISNPAGSSLSLLNSATSPAPSFTTPPPDARLLNPEDYLSLFTPAEAKSTRAYWDRYGQVGLDLYNPAFKTFEPGSGDLFVTGATSLLPAAGALRGGALAGSLAEAARFSKPTAALLRFLGTLGGSVAGTEARDLTRRAWMGPSKFEKFQQEQRTMNYLFPGLEMAENLAPNTAFASGVPDTLSQTVSGFTMGAAPEAFNQVQRWASTPEDDRAFGEMARDATLPTLISGTTGLFMSRPTRAGQAMERVPDGWPSATARVTASLHGVFSQPITAESFRPPSDYSHQTEIASTGRSFFSPSTPTLPEPPLGTLIGRSGYQYAGRLSNGLNVIEHPSGVSLNVPDSHIVCMEFGDSASMAAEPRMSATSPRASIGSRTPSGPPRRGGMGSGGSGGRGGGSGGGRGGRSGGAGGEPLPNNPDWLNQVRQQPHLQEYANKWGVTSEQYSAEAQEHLRSLLKDAMPFMRIPSIEVLSKILKSGNFKTQFETGTTSGSPDLKDRAQVEQSHFNIAPNARLSQRPKYGYLHFDPTGRLPDGDDPFLWEYGTDIAVRFKPSVLERTTFTVGDSLDETDAGKDPRIAALPFHSPGWEAIPDTVGDIMEYPNFEALGRRAQSTNFIFKKERVGYIEAQFHGDLRARDIEEVIFYGKPPSATVKKLLAQRRVNYRVVEK